jgi:hypothetical protein
MDKIDTRSTTHSYVPYDWGVGILVYEKPSDPLFVGGIVVVVIVW